MKGNSDTSDLDTGKSIRQQIFLGKVKGYYKDDAYEIHIAESWHHSRVFCNGQVFRCVKKCVITLEAGKPTKVKLERLALKPPSKEPKKQLYNLKSERSR